MFKIFTIQLKSFQISRKQIHRFVKSLIIPILISIEIFLLPKIQYADTYNYVHKYEKNYAIVMFTIY